MSELTAERIVATARAEFLRRGYEGASFTRIARLVGAAPNTLYRFYKGKTELFVAVYRTWAEAERAALVSLLARSLPVAAMVDSCIARRRQHTRFRRSTRRLMYEEPQVRRAVAKARLATMDTLVDWLGAPTDRAALAADLVQFEQLGIALAEGEFRDLGVAEDAAREHMVAILMHWRVRAAPRPYGRDDLISA